MDKISDCGPVSCRPLVQTFRSFKCCCLFNKKLLLMLLLTNACDTMQNCKQYI